MKSFPILGTIGWLLSAQYCFSENNFSEYKNLLRLFSVNEPRPVISNIASGFGAYKGQLYFAVSYSDLDLQTSRDTKDNDGSLGFGFGLGDPVKSLGLDTTVGVTSVSTKYWGDGNFGDEGNISFKIHKRVNSVLGGRLASIGIGSSNAIGWGSTVENPSNNYFAYSEQSSFGDFKQYGIAYSFGYGTSVSDTETTGDMFGGLALAYDNYSVSISNIGRETHLSGTWFMPFLSGTSLTFSRADAFEKLESSRNIVTLSYATTLKN